MTTRIRRFLFLWPALALFAAAVALADEPCEWCENIVHEAETRLAAVPRDPACEGRPAFGRCAAPTVPLGGFLIELPTNLSSVFTLSAQSTGPNSFLVRGTDSYGRRMLLKVVNGVLEGSIDGPQERWDIVSDSAGPRLVERPANIVAPDGDDVIEPPADEKRGPQAAAKAALAPLASAPASGPVTADLLVLYTPEVEAELGGYDGLIAHVVYLEALLNDTLEASGVTHRIRLVGIEPSDVPNELYPRDAVEVLREDLAAAAAREALGADLVLLLRKITVDQEANQAGVAYVFQNSAVAADYAYGVASLGCVIDESQSFMVCGGDDVVLHEIGHMLGAGHEMGAEGVRWKSYSYASACGNPINGAYTLVGSRPPWVRYYSSPIVVHEGFLCGDGVTSDNARTIQEALPIVADFRAPVDTLTPSIEIVVSPSTVYVGEEVTIGWFALNVDQCEAFGDWSGSKPTSGTETFVPTEAGTRFLRLSCMNGVESILGSATLEVLTQAAPVVEISVTPSSVLVNETATIEWATADASSCSAAGAWMGVKALAGAQSVSFSIPGEYVFELTCEGPGGSTSAEATLTVEALPDENEDAPQGPPGSDEEETESSSGGGGATGLEGLFFLLAIVGLKLYQRRLRHAPVRVSASRARLPQAKRRAKGH